MKILYLGDNSDYSTSLHRARALERIGHQVQIENPFDLISNLFLYYVTSKFHFHTGYFFIQNRIEIWLKAILIKNNNFDLVWIDSGELFGTTCLKIIKSYNKSVVLYNIDDPTGKRDGNRFKSLIRSLRYYDLVVVVRKESRDECIELGAKNILMVERGYDEIAHKPFDSIEEIDIKYKSDVAFIGTWMRGEKRDKFILDLINSGINVSIWGDRWSKSKEWNKIKSFYKGKSLGGKDYVSAIQGAKICIGLLSKGNRDIITTRSLEIPFAGGLLCGERTLKHLDFFTEGKDALFWDSPGECASICDKYLKNDILREQMRLNGSKKVRMLGVGNENICRKILLKINNIN
jgi:hypothetical protein